MSIIGHFRPSRSGGWEGQVRTLCLNVSLRFAPNDDRSHPNAPTFRVMVGHSHIGDAWERGRHTDPPRPMFRVLLDDPLLPTVLDAALFPDEAGEKAILVWQRQTPRRRGEQSAASDREGAASDQEPVADRSSPFSGGAAFAHS
ncbi:MAG: hypothetical protein B7Z12_00655 [Caulobacter vibrioides]|uniref:DUF736 domain-containing protein n=1 Tax=Caulobacter vibrioides TaxID=155892 RepID=A0A258DEH3_CAUVI|nr:MAG: hypothetical protein B7Z12_00655 [Caulobacter vibrioides]